MRAETLAGAAWIFSALAGAVGVIRRMLLRITARSWRCSALISLLPYATYLVGLLMLIDRVGFRLAIALALGLWTMATAVMIGLWRMLDGESLV